jgi:catechol 2,3-dioxygenase-like lactoylglutathione lyase family enzyme
MTTLPSLEMTQVAMVCDRTSQSDTLDWYRNTLGFEPKGGLSVTNGPNDTNLMRLSEPPSVELGWLVDYNDVFQIEIFSFDPPKPRLKPDSWSPRDIGYSFVSLWVSDFDGTVERARSAGSLTTGPVGADGSRRALVTDPNANLLELLEQDPAGPDAAGRPELGVAVRCVRASVPDLTKSIRYFQDGFGLEAVSDPHFVHGPADESLWGLEGADPKLVTFRIGDLFLELAEYDDPRGAPWPEGHQLSDGGIMNIALATTSMQAYEDRAAHLEGMGFDVRGRKMNDDVCLSYCTDDQGFSVELLFMAPAAYEAFGFHPLQED